MPVPDASLLETGTHAGASVHARARLAASAQARQTFIGGAMAAMGLSLCRPGQKYCRPRLKQPGRRQLERRLKMNGIQACGCFGDRANASVALRGGRANPVFFTRFPRVF